MRRSPRHLAAKPPSRFPIRVTNGTSQEIVGNAGGQITAITQITGTTGTLDWDCTNYSASPSLFIGVATAVTS